MIVWMIFSSVSF